MITTVNLPDELHARIKEIAAAEHRSVNAAIVVAVEQYVAGREDVAAARRAAREVVEKNGELLDRLAQ